MANTYLKCWWVWVDDTNTKHITIKFKVFIPSNFVIVDENPVPEDGDIWNNVNGSAIVNYKIINQPQNPSTKDRIELKTSEVFLSKNWDPASHVSGIKVTYIDGSGGTEEEEESMATSSADLGLLEEDK